MPSLEAFEHQEALLRDEARIFARLTSILLGIFLPFTGVYLLLLLVTHEASLLYLSSITGCYSMILILARAAAPRHLVRTVQLVCGSMLVAAIATVVVVPQIFPVLAVVPLLAVAITLPLLSAKTLTRFSLVCWGASVLIVSIGISAAIQHGLQPDILIFVTWGALPATIAIALLLLAQFHGRLFAVIAQLDRSHTRLVASESTVRDQHRQMLTTLQSMTDAVVTADSALRITLLNDAAEHLFHAPLETVIGQLLPTLVGETLWATLTQMATSQPTEFTPASALANGGNESLWVTGILRPLKLAESGWVVIVRDVSALVRAEAERQQLEIAFRETQKLEALGVLAGGIAHDFNNLLTIIGGQAELALLDDSATPWVTESLQTIHRATQRAADLTRQMLLYVGSHDGTLHHINVTELIRDITTLLYTSVEKHITLQLRLDPALVFIEGNTSQLQQVIMNVIINAAEAIGKVPGTVTLQTQMQHVDHERPASSALPHGLRPGHYLAWIVTDTGSGMDAATISHMFEPFFTTKFTGRGLGLSAVLGIVRGHGGAIHVESQVGTGTKVTVLLPITDVVEPAPTNAAPTLSTSTAAASYDSILIVDDEHAIRTLLTQLLERHGYQTLVASDGSSALDLYRQHQARIKAILLDLTMPVLDGAETTRVLRTMNATVPIILMSGYTADTMAARIDPATITAYVTKPLNLHEVIAILRASIA